MRNISLIIIFLIFFGTLTSFSQSNNQKCDPSPPPPGPGGDHGDENYSFANIDVGDFTSFSTNPEVFVLKSGYYKEAICLISKFTNEINIFDGSENLYDFNQSRSIALIPSGGLVGKENDTMLEYTLEDYVRNGGFLIVLCQTIIKNNMA